MTGLKRLAGVGRDRQPDAGSRTQYRPRATLHHGTEFQFAGARRLGLSAGRATRLRFAPGNPWEMRLVNRSLNGRMHDECSNVHQFALLAEAQTILDAWRFDYNNTPPAQLTRTPDAE